MFTRKGGLTEEQKTAQAIIIDLEEHEGAGIAARAPSKTIMIEWPGGGIIN